MGLRADSTMSMDENWLSGLAEAMRGHGVSLEPGLTDAEVNKVEQRYGFRFPPDLRSPLRFALPIDQRFPNWRAGPEAALRKQWDWPADGICFDIEHNEYWMETWGPRPSTLYEAFCIARAEVARAPVLIPVYGHRYLPSEPEIAGNPVYSVWQTDIIYYGYDLASYFHHEFHAPLPSWATTAPRPIRFWAEIVDHRL
jgi:hypothetical protein